MKRIAILLWAVCLPVFLFAQNMSSDKFGKGITIQAQDTSFSMKFSTRFQTLYEGKTDVGSGEWNDKLMIRRARLKFEGFAYSPKLTYKIELGISNRDTGKAIKEINSTAGVILDAVLKYKFAPGWEFWAGQTKLPGNRERVISSQKLQFVDRSLVNGEFNIDRDLGIQLHNKAKLGDKVVLKQAGAISMGEGRNVTVGNIGGYSYTYRMELLPFGEFTSKGDYFGSDLKREETPKLAIGASYNFNDGASREKGQLGNFYLDAAGDYVMTDLSTIFVDFIFKYNGLSVVGEYANKKNVDEIVALPQPGKVDKFISGQGYVMQAGYLFKNNLELAGRYTSLGPDDVTFSGLDETKEYTLGLSRYFSEHNFKVQSDFSLTQIPGNTDEVRFRLQCELNF